MHTTEFADKLRQMIDGKLTDEGKETRTIQIILTGNPSSKFSLKDADGIFLTIAAAEETLQESSAPSEQALEEDLEPDPLYTELEALSKETQAEVSELERKLGEKKLCFRDMLTTNCHAWPSMLK